MTQSLTALFSPETSPQPADLQPFLLLCNALFFYTLPEQSAAQPNQPSLTDQPGPETGYTPVRLSKEEQTRFLSLAKELRGHEAEFHSGLLASLSAAHSDRDETSVGSLASSMRSGAKPVHPQKTADETLWQAMLILKLAEMLREEEREIAQGFLAISGKEAELFAAIRGEETEADDEDEEEEQTLQELAAASVPGPTINLTRLAKAWGRLYTRDTKAIEIPLLATTHEELQSLLADTYEALTGRLPVQLVSLALPSQTGSEGFKTATEASREQFNRLLLGVAASQTITAEGVTELQGAGNDLNRAALPFLKDNTSEKTMRLYAYEGVSLMDLFARLCGAPTAEAQQTTAATGLLAVLS